MAKSNEEQQGVVNESEKRVKCKTIGKDAYIFTPNGVAVYDVRGKRRIGKDSRVIVRLAERVVYDDVEYIVKSITAKHVILKRI